MTERDTHASPEPSSLSTGQSAPPHPCIPSSRGRVDTCEGPRVLGWLLPEEGQEARATIELWIEGEHCATATADGYRQDLEEGGIGDGRHAFALVVPPRFCDGQPHLCEVREAASGMPLTGSPINVEYNEPAVDGSVDTFDEEGIHGWAVHTDGSSTSVSLEWSIVGNASVSGSVDASRLRADLAAEGYGDGRHGFVINVPDDLLDGAEHLIEVRSDLDGRHLRGSPFRFRASPVWWWKTAEDLDETERRKAIERTLDQLEETDAADVDLDALCALADMGAWLASLAPGRLLRRLRETAKRLQNACFEVQPLHFADRDRLHSAITDLRGGKDDLTLELVEGDRVWSSAVLFKGPRKPGARRELNFTLPTTLLDQDIHRLSLRVLPAGLDFGPWSFLMPAPDDTLDASPDIDPIWETTPGVQAARKRRREKARAKPTKVELARLRLDDAELDPTDEEEREKLLELTLALAHALRDAGEWVEAVDVFDRARALDPESLDAVTGAIRSLLAKGDDGAAEARIAAAMEYEPDESALHALRDQLMARRRSHSVRTLAFYLPQFHPTPENDEWWGKGFTEWHNVGGAAPLFPGHLQPRRPTTLGYYDLRLAESANAQFDLARKFGIDGFCYYYYWFEGRRILERPLDDLVAGRTGPFPFCICWANEDWTRSWDGATGEVLLAQNHAPESDFRFIQDLAPLLRHKDYIRVDGKPMVLVYRAGRLSTPKETVDAWRAWCREEGIGELYLCAVESFGFYDPRPLGFDAAVEFPPHCLRDRYPELGYLKELDVVKESFRGTAYSYQAFASAAMARQREPFTLHRTSMVAWDNTPRRGKDGVVYHWFTTDTFDRWNLANARRAAAEQGDGICFVNAWNEWAEGSVLEPDAAFGYTNLESVRSVKKLLSIDHTGTYWLGGQPRIPLPRLEPREKIILIGHDAHPHGAQINMLHMARCLKRDIGTDLEIMLVEGGDLLPDYEKVAPTFVIGASEGWQAALRARLQRFAHIGARKAICNTVVTGDVCEVLKQEGFKVVGLLHELPTLIEAYGLQSQCWRFADKTDAIVCASQLVADEFANRYWPDPKKILVAPQGIAFNRYHDTRAKTRALIRKELGLLPGSLIVTGCGYGDTRKGIDIFVQIAGEICRRHPAGQVAFVWIGALDPAMEPYVKADVKRLDLEDVFHVTGRTNDPARFFIAGDVFALTSREDPFPSVVMEAFDARMPVVAFDGGGGYVDIVGDETGALVPYLDVAAMTDVVDVLLQDADKREALGTHCHALCRERFGYAPYMRKLLALLADVPAEQVAAGHLQRQGWFAPGHARPRITAIVPNFNYARYLELRLRTIAAQTLPPDEIIVLDDASTDTSLAVIEAVAAGLGIPVTVITNEQNTANPFVQWARGLEKATGDLVWIAEADDYCEPTLLETLARELVDDKVVMAWSDSIMVDEDGRGHGAQYKDYYARSYGEKWRLHFRMPGRELVEDCLLVENVIPNASAVLFRRSAVSFDLGPIKQYRFSGDWWFWLSLALQGDLVYRADPLNYHRRHHRSVMGDVLRAGESLLPETMGFYERVVARYPGVVTARNTRDVLKRLDGLYEMFPKLQDEGASVKEHPRFGAQWQQLDQSLAAAVPRAGTAGREALVLSMDVLESPSADVKQLVRDVTARGGLAVLLASEEVAEEAVKALGLEETFVHHCDLERKGEFADAPAVLMDRDGVAHALAGILAGAHIANVVSHGLIAHALLNLVATGLHLRWTLLGGSEFDALLGSLPNHLYVDIRQLEEAISNADKLAFIGHSSSHSLGRFAQKFLKPLDTWVRVDQFGARDVFSMNSRKNATFRFAAGMTPNECLDLASFFCNPNSALPSSSLNVSLLAWGASVDNLRHVFSNIESVEVVEGYGVSSMDLARIN